MSYRDDSIEARFLRGDLEAVATVVRWIATVVASSRFGALRPEWLDLHQEIMERVIESLRRERFDDSQDLRAYVQAVARYTALQALGVRRRTPRVASLDERSLAVETGAFSRQLARQVLDQSSDGCRDLLKAYFFEQRSYAEIATSLGVPVGTVKSRLVRCLETAHRVVEGPRASRHPRPD